MFELAYKQSLPKAPAYLGLSLSVTGKKLYNKKVKERKSEIRNVTPVVPKTPSGDTVSEKEQPIPAEYTGPIITDFLTWLNPYDSIPVNKDDILLGANDSVMVRHALTVVKSGLIMKTHSKKRKSATLSSRTRSRRERNAEHRRRIVPHSCCRQDESTSCKQIGKYRTESASKSEISKVDRSVGNKRCYIDPIEWERETASILRPTISIQNKLTSKLGPTPVRHTKSGMVTSFSKSLTNLNTRSNQATDDTAKKISAIGRNICKLRDEGKTSKKTKFIDSYSSLYAPFHVVMTPVNKQSK